VNSKWLHDHFTLCSNVIFSYEVSAESISWRNFDHNKQSYVRCASSTDNYRGFYIQVNYRLQTIGEINPHLVDLNLFNTVDCKNLFIFYPSDSLF